MFNVLLALSPVLVILIGMFVFKKSAMKVAPIAMVYTFFLEMFFSMEL